MTDWIEQKKKKKRIQKIVPLCYTNIVKVLDLYYSMCVFIKALSMNISDGERGSPTLIMMKLLCVEVQSIE